MDSEYRAYLASQILTEDLIVTYRSLSRTLKIHVNTAKQILFEFHRQQNVKKPGSVYATYLIAGYKRAQEIIVTKDGEFKNDLDEPIQSHLFQSSPAPREDRPSCDFSVLSISLVKEEDLRDLEVNYEQITSMHVYSLRAVTSKDLQVLSDVMREIREKYSYQDPLEVALIHGTIANNGVKRRTGRRQPPSINPVRVSQPSTASMVNSDHKRSQEENMTPATTSFTKDLPEDDSRKERVSSSRQLKRDSSSIFKSFAKVKPKLKKEDTDSSVHQPSVDSTVPSQDDDKQMKYISDDEEENYQPPPMSKELVDRNMILKKEREEALRKMMDDDSNDEAPLEQLPEDNTATNEVIKPLPIQDTETAVQVTGGRRRGKRRVMKKKTMKDEEGYLVTREEPGWESFSEDDTVIAKSNPPSSSFSTSAKSKKTVSKSQGSIMSFFSKPK